MTPGLLVRKLLGKRLFPIVGRYYRAIFVDLSVVAAFMSEQIPPKAHVLDIGGGDGEPLNHLLSRRNDVTVTMIDVSKNIGIAISQRYRDRVSVYPQTSISQYIGMNLPAPQVIIVSDVIHHIAPPERVAFLNDLHALFRKSNAVLLIKDLEPGSLIAKLAYLSDRYITMDKNVVPVAREELRRLIANAFGKVVLSEHPLFDRDRPNYMFSVRQ